MPTQPPSPPDHRKPCTLCATPCNVRIRCQIDSTRKWHLVCPGRCWKAVSGGIVDGDGNEEHQFYRYGGVWKNKFEAVSGKKKKKKKSKKGGGKGVVPLWMGMGVKYSVGDRVRVDAGGGDVEVEGDVEGLREGDEKNLRGGKVWIAKRSHVSDDGKKPGLWAEGWEEEEALDVEAVAGRDTRESSR
jgi:hypothetical protein